MSEMGNEYPSQDISLDQIEPLPIPRLGSLVLYAADLERTMTFYRLFGLVFASERHGSGPFHYSTMLGETLLEIYPAPLKTLSAQATVRIGLLTPSIEGTLKHCTLSPEYPVKTSPYGRFVTFKDPDGRTVELRERPVAEYENWRAYDRGDKIQKKTTRECKAPDG